jgi:hypothetical protein
VSGVAAYILRLMRRLWAHHCTAVLLHIGSTSSLAACVPHFDRSRFNLDFIAHFFVYNHCRKRVVMDSLDLLTTNSQLYWTRLENSSRCCESETSSIEPVHVIDIPPTMPQPGEQVSLKKEECVNFKSLNEYLSDPTNANYAIRLV